MANRPTAIILTGAPGVGKTSLLGELQRQNFKCNPEPARIVLAEQRASGGPALPEKDPEAFCAQLLSRSIEDFRVHGNSEKIVFFDRGVPDYIAYAGSFGLDTQVYLEAAQKYLYNKTVFLLPPWEEIYQTDDERKMNFTQVCEFHDLICKAYLNLGYHLIEVPRTSLENRVSFLTESLDSL